MNEEEVLNEIEFCLVGEYITSEHREAIEGLLSLYQKEKEKNKKLEEVTHNLAQAIRFMGTNEKLTIEDIIKEFSKENKVTEDFMERWEKSQLEESHLKDKVIDLMAEKLRDLKDDIDTLHEGEIDCFIPKDFCNINGCAKYKDCADCIKEYYFNKVKEKK